VADQFYVGLRDNTVLPLIKQFGQPMSLKSNREPTIDPDTGMITTAAAEVLTTFDGLFRFYSQDEINGKDVLANDIQVLCEASAFNTAGITPDSSMQVIAQGVTYNVVRETPTMPGGVRVLTRLQIRR
jgi:hypothetical protein